MIDDGLIRSPRAGFEISPKCPSEYKSILSYCIDMRLIQPVAYVTERELLFIGLSNDIT